MTFPRPLSGPEQEVLQTLLGFDFPGVDALRAQVPGVRVTGQCDCGCPSVELEARPDTPRAVVVNRQPVSAVVVDTQGDATGHVLLFVDDGALSYLEYATLALDDDDTPPQFPPADRLTGVWAEQSPRPEVPQPTRDGGGPGARPRRRRGADAASRRGAAGLPRGPQYRGRGG